MAPRRHQEGTKSALSAKQIEILKACLESQAISVLMKRIGRSDRTKFRKAVLTPLLDSRFLAMTVPDKPNSPNQKYQTTSAGMAELKKQVGKPYENR